MATTWVRIRTWRPRWRSRPRYFKHTSDPSRQRWVARHVMVNQTVGTRAPDQEGRADGNIGIPDPATPVFPPYVLYVADFVGEIIQEVGRRFLYQDRVLFERQRDLETRIANLDETADTSQRIATVDEPAEKGPSLSPAAFWFFAMAITAFEFPLTRRVIEALGVEGSEQMLVTLALQIVLFAAAKICGVLIFKIRHIPPLTSVQEPGAQEPGAQERGTEDKRFLWIAAATLAALVVLTSGGLAFFRTELVRLEAGRDNRRQAAFDEFERRIGTATETDESVEGHDLYGLFSVLAFGPLLLLTFGVGTTLSWLSHDPRLERLGWSRNARIQIKTTRLKRELAVICATRKRRYQHADVDADEWEQWSAVLQRQYWGENKRARRRPISPELDAMSKTLAPVPKAIWRTWEYDFGGET